MTVSKDPAKGTWHVQFYYKDWTGTHKKKHKRGFATKREAVAWAEQFKHQQSKSLDMTLKSLVDIYMNDMENRLRENTLRSKRYIIDLKILPYFENKKVADITAADIRMWQNTLIQKGYAQTTLRTINNQMSAIMNYAVNFYDLPKNPCRQAGSIGKGNADEMKFWTKDEYEQFLSAIEDNEVSRIAFQILYWTGIRIGELLALQMQDVDLEQKLLHITKSFQRINGRDVITEPKTKKGKRVITLPDFLVEEIQSYLNRLYGFCPTDRMFSFTKSYMEHKMETGIKRSGVKHIRLHDLRHSHASLLISELNASPLLVADRLGHEKIQTTLQTYSHIFPNKSRDLADSLNSFYENDGDSNARDT